jgi:hypothetical protein
MLFDGIVKKLDKEIYNRGEGCKYRVNFGLKGLFLCQKLICFYVLCFWECSTVPNDRDPRKSELLQGYLGLRTAYHSNPPHLHMSETYVSGKKEMKEGDQGTKRAQPKARKENQRPSSKKECGSKKEDLKKKTLSRNRPPASIQNPIRCHTTVSKRPNHCKAITNPNSS